MAASDKESKALDMAVSALEKQFGKGSIMRLGDKARAWSEEMGEQPEAESERGRARPRTQEIRTALRPARCSRAIHLVLPYHPARCERVLASSLVS